MITIISGTNRSNSRTELISNQLQEIIQELSDEEVRLLPLTDLPDDLLHNEMYEESKMSDDLKTIQDDYILSADKWIILTPEYNGSYTGILKLFIDAISIRQYSKTFKNKKVALIGVASGRGGNLRGLEHLTGALHYLGVHVMPEKLPLSNIENHIEEDQLDDLIYNTLRVYADTFLGYEVR